MTYQSETKFPTMLLCPSKGVPIRKLDLSYCNLKKIPNCISSMKYLRKIDLSCNKITEIKPGIFSNLINLHSLIITANDITEILPKTFENLPKLMVLNLCWNQDLTIFHPKAFYNLPKLEELYISTLKISRIHHRTFENLPKLRKIDISSNSSLIPTPELFSNLPNSLEELDFSYSQIFPKIFVNLPNLKILTLRRWNDQTTLYPESFYNLQKLEILDLSNRDLPYNPRRSEATMEIKAGAFKKLPKLRKINLSNNSLIIMSPEIFNDLPSLKILDLNETGITEIKAIILLDWWDFPLKRVPTKGHSSFRNTKILYGRGKYKYKIWTKKSKID